MVDRVTLTQIAPVAWEHATDRAALQTLRALPGFDEVVRKVMGSLVSVASSTSLRPMQCGSDHDSGPG